MSYEKQVFVDWELDDSGNVVKEGTTLNAGHLQHIEKGILANEKELENKQPKGNYLTEHQKLKTINGQSVVGNGDISGLTAEQIIAIDSLFRVCAFTKPDVAEEYKAFKAAFGIADNGDDEPGDSGDTGGSGGDTEVTLARISATYSGADMAVGTDVSDIVGVIVTAHYSDGSAKTVSGFTLSLPSGQIVEGNNTVTVSYAGKTTTIEITGVTGGESINVVQPVSSGANYLKTNSDYNVTAWECDSAGTMYKAYSYTLTAGITYRISAYGKHHTYPIPPFVAVKLSDWDGSFVNEKTTLFDITKAIYIERTDGTTGTYTRDYTPAEDCRLYVLDSATTPVAWVMY